MFIPSGFGQRSLVTSLGRMVYYTQESAPWLVAGESFEDLPDLVFLHGFGGGSSAYEWSKVFPAFASQYRILAPDLIGWGRSEHPERQYQVEDYLTTLTEFLEKACRTPAIVVASSLTAAMIIRVAIAKPQLFQALFLSAPAGLSDFDEDYSRTPIARLVTTPFVDRFFYNAGVATALGIQSFLELRQFARPERIYSEIVEAYLASAKQPNAEYAALSFVRGDLSFDLALYMPQLTVPTAVIWGRKSQFSSSDLGRRLADLNPQAIRSFEVLEDVGLTPQLELPAVTIALIQRFLHQLTGSNLVSA
jgi:pimeloyl-ACP methyl ester carboxylesterase